MDWGQYYLLARGLYEELLEPIPKELDEKSSKELKNLIVQLTRKLYQQKAKKGEEFQW